MSVQLSRVSRAGRVLITLGALCALVFGTALSASAEQAPLENQAPPAIVGSPNVGVTLTVDPGTWTGANTDAFTYLWTIGDTLVSSTDSYVVQPGDFTKAIVVTEKAYADGDNSATASSDAVTIVAPATVVTAPVLTGATVSGSTLTVTDGTYSDPGAQITYQWGFEHPDDPILGGGNGGSIPGATAATYVIADTYIADYMQVTVTATYKNGNVIETTLKTAGLVTAAAVVVSIPAAPIATDAGLTAANQGGIGGAVSGTTATLTLPAGLADGTQVYVYGYSTPTPLGFATVNGNKITVNFAALPAGHHKLLVIGPTGVVLGWFGVSLLAATGANVAPVEWYLAGGALLLGALLVGFGVYIRRRTAAL